MTTPRAIPACLRREAPDPVRDELQRRWHETRATWVADGMPDMAPSWRAFQHVDALLTAHLWKKVQDAIMEDRRQHLKAKRNLPVGAESAGTGGRYLP